MHNGDVVHLIWKKMTNPDLSQYVTALKVQFQREPRDYKDVFQEIASQVPTLRVDTFRKTSEVRRQESANSNSGCPTVGAHDKHGKLYTGTYPYNKWQSESVRPNWKEIRYARGDNTRRRARERKSEIETTISELTSKKAKIEASISSIATDNSSASISKLGTSQAGNSFGGRFEKSKHP